MALYNWLMAEPKLPTKPTPRISQDRKDLLSTVSVLVSAIIVAVLITLFAFQSYRVDGHSMDTTLANNDRLIIDKIPRTLARITGHAYIPKRGDIIVFNAANLGLPPEDSQLIKRVIGLPGDRVVIKNDQLTIYNSAHPAGFDPDTTGQYQLGSSINYGDMDFQLTANQIFVMGDNRANSTDSHAFGPIDVNRVIGKLVVRVLPLNSSKTF